MTATLIEAPPTAAVLMERDTAGLHVQLCWDKTLGVSLFVQEGEEIPVLITIPSEKALDAFEHPYLYLQAAGLR